MRKRDQQPHLGVRWNLQRIGWQGMTSASTARDLRRRGYSMKNLNVASAAHVDADGEERGPVRSELNSLLSNFRCMKKQHDHDELDRHQDQQRGQEDRRRCRSS